MATIYDDIFADKDLAIFFHEWIRSGLNAKKAYQSIHPKVSDHSAETLGSRMLRKVEIRDILSVYGLGLDIYMNILKEGLESQDLKIRRFYHELLGKLLGIDFKEHEKPQAQQIIVTRGY